MGFYFGIMFQLIDDYKDKDKDESFNNFINVLGIQKSIEKYKESKAKLILLLTKYNLNNEKFGKLLELLDNEFIKFTIE